MRCVSHDIKYEDMAQSHQSSAVFPVTVVKAMLVCTEHDASKEGDGRNYFSRRCKNITINYKEENTFSKPGGLPRYNNISMRCWDKSSKS